MLEINKQVIQPQADTSYCATVYIFYEAGSWMLSFPFYCTDLSYEGFRGLFVSSKENDVDPCSFLEEKKTYSIQLDPINRELIFPQTKIILSSIEQTSDSIQISCSFIDRSKELIDAVNQIKLTTG